MAAAEVVVVAAEVVAAAAEVVVGTAEVVVVAAEVVVAVAELVVAVEWMTRRVWRALEEDNHSPEQQASTTSPSSRSP